MIHDILHRLPDPPADYRGTPFWAWNAKLDPAEIREQIRIFHKMGLGGFFMHSRTGLGTPYLGKEWFDCVHAAVDEAKSLGMQPWMYDEDRWPSGAAGGIVTKNRRYRMRWLGREVVAHSAVAKAARRRHTLAWFAERVAAEGESLPEAEVLRRAREDGRDAPPRVLSGYRRLAAPTEALRDGEALVRYFVVVARANPWYNGQAYLDTLNPAAVRKFVKVTHEAYKRELGEEFGKVVPGCFTDEPNFAANPWTDAFASKFRKRFGYDILDRMPELFSAVGDGTAFSKARHDFREMATTLFVRAFAKTVGDWCGKHGLLFTGHVLEEDTLGRQTQCVGAAMRFYEYQQAPGIDQLTEHWSIYQTAKQCSSVAHQLGRDFRLVEAYGCSGWDFPIEGHKAIGDWLVALGINHRCQHLAWYSMDAQAKRDYPASISRQSPWHGRYKAEEDYFARIGETLGAGSEVTPLLVVHPVESAWGHFASRHDTPQLCAMDDAFVALTGTLLGEHLDFDYGDEDHLDRRGRLSRKRLRVGQALYDAVLVPEMETIRSSTLRLLSAFAARGGRVLYLGKAPALVDAEPSKAAAEAYKAFAPTTLETLAKDLAFVRRVSVADRRGECAAVLYQERECGDGLALFLCNTSDLPPLTADRQQHMPLVRDRTMAYPHAVLRVRAPMSRGAVYELDLETGAIRPIRWTHRSGWYRISAPLGRLQSRMILISNDPDVAARADLPAKAREKAPARVEIPAEGLAYRLDDDNALVLDAARWSVDGGETRPVTRVLDIDEALRDMLGAPHRGGHMKQPWCSASVPAGRRLALRLDYTFHCEDLFPMAPVDLAIERPDLYTIRVNDAEVSQLASLPVDRFSGPDSKKPENRKTGKPEEPGESPWWVDPCLKRLRIPAGAIRPGENHLVLEGMFDETCPGLEAMFLLGAFGVSNDGRALTSLPASLRAGDVCSQGLPNYSGNLVYRFRAAVPAEGPCVLAPPDWRGTALGFRVNGGAEVFRPFPPYEAVFDKELRRDGTDEFEVAVYGHRRNAFGPFYVRGGVKWPHWTGPGEMRDTAETTRALVPFGLGAGGGGKKR